MTACPALLGKTSKAQQLKQNLSLTAPKARLAPPQVGS